MARGLSTRMRNEAVDGTSNAQAARQHTPVAGGLKNLERIGLSKPLVEAAVNRRLGRESAKLQMFWDYYRNPMQGATPLLGSGGLSQHGFRLAQERGLPSRVAGHWQSRGAAAAILDRAGDWSRKEVVIENDIAWRINTMVDFMFGKPVRLTSTARDASVRSKIEHTLAAVWEASGGVGLLMDMGVIGHVYGSVDLVVKVKPENERHAQNDESEAAARPAAGKAASAGGGAEGEPAADSAAGAEGAALNNEHVRAWNEGGVGVDTESGSSPESPEDQESQPRLIGGSSQANSGANPDAAPSSTLHDAEQLATFAAECVRIEVVRPGTGVAITEGGDHRHLRAYIVRTERETDDLASAAGAFGMVWALRRIWRGEDTRGDQASNERKREIITEVYCRGVRQTYRAPISGHETSTSLGDAALIDESPAIVEARAGDGVPVVHIQNLAQPFEFDGLGEVEPLVSLQDELNTRLSDRASRVTMQSFRMFLAKGIDGASQLPVAPGIIWSTDNQEASVATFGGDGFAPSEERHIQEVREAMDKVSGVPPVAGGVVQAKVGNLSSENALRITLIGLIGKTARKQITYGRGIAQTSALVLEALDRLGILKTRVEDRGVRVDWTDPLPKDENDQLTAAERKLAMGVPRERVLAELGYGHGDPGVV